MRRIALLLILLAAAAARLWYLAAGVPHAVAVEESQLVDRAVRILHTGDWNPHVFDYPTLVVYGHAVVAIVRFLWGALNGEWGSLDRFSTEAIYLAGRTATAAIGVTTVWLTYRLGALLASRAVGLLAAAQLAVLPLHVRASHYILTDVPMTALTTLALWLALRAMRLGTGRAYAWAGAACGLAAAAQYIGGVAIVAVLAAWLLGERGSPTRGRTLAAAVGGAVAAFLLLAPYTLLDMPAFLDGFAASTGRAQPGEAAADPAWLFYAQQVTSRSRPIVPFAAAGAVVLLWRARTRTMTVPLVAFSAAFFYALASGAAMSDGRALPLAPILALCAAAAALELVAALLRLRAMQRPALEPLLTGALIALLLWPGADASVEWLDSQKRPDTRTLAAEWLASNAPQGAKIAVEHDGPSYLRASGFGVVATRTLPERSLDWYRQNADYLVMTATDTSGYDDYLAGGRLVYQIGPTSQRFGPPVTVIALR